MIDLDDAARRLVEQALDEDVGPGDWSTLWTVSAAARADAEITAKADGVIAGLELARFAFQRRGPELDWRPACRDGDAVRSGDAIARVHGPARPLLTAERTALNFLQRLSGIATLTRRFADAVTGTGARIMDTRKTTPGWRRLEKQAVLAGGAANHRIGLFDMILLKENHIAAARGIGAALDAVRAANDAGLPVEVEVRSLDELEEALSRAPDRVLLDNMPLDTLRAAVARVRRRAAPRPQLEASGNVGLHNVRAVAETGVDFISVGALTHSAPALDLSLVVRSG